MIESSSSSEEEDPLAPARDCDRTVVYKHKHGIQYEQGMSRVELPAYIQEKKLLVKAQPKKTTVAVKNIQGL